ncbi:MAG TPA: protoglobin domain-containing protein [Polyangia bacterium]
MESVFEELKRYVAWSATDEAALRALHPHAAPHFSRIAEVFYARILGHEGARQALIGGESRVGQLKVTLIAWMDRLLAGPWDDEYFQLRCRIGRVHVRIALPQHYMFGAMNLVRRELNEIVDAEHGDDPDRFRRARIAVGKILDLELAIMLHTYREDLIAQQARTERLATFGQLIGSIGHELRNPLGVIESSLYILDQRVGGDDRAKKHIGRIGEQLHVANDIISALLDMIRDRPLSREKIILDDTIASVLGSLTLPGRVSVSGIDTLPPIDGDAVQIRQVFMNLIDNAAHAAGADGEIRIEGRVDGRVVEIAVEDSGPGVDAETRRRLFEPLITTKTKGIGLGLALVRRIVTRHGGDVAYAPHDRAGAGARFVVRLPIGGADAA